MKRNSKKELNSYEHYLTVGGLKEFCDKHKLPDSAKVVIQRVEDVYYEEYGWGVYLKECEHTVKDSDGIIVKSSLEQYHPAWCCVNYEGEKNILFIDLHY